MDEAMSVLKREMAELGADLRYMQQQLQELELQIELQRARLHQPNAVVVEEEKKAPESAIDAFARVAEHSEESSEELEPVAAIAVVPTPESPTPVAESPVRPVSR